MEIYTSYFSKYKELKENNICCIAISRFVPSYLKDKVIRIMELAPSYEMIKGKYGRDGYIERYNEILGRYTAKEIVAMISEKKTSDKVALLCYESPDKFCHRHLLAEYLKRSGIDVSEYNGENRQLELF